MTIMPPFSFYTPWKHQETTGFLMFSGYIERGLDMKWFNLLALKLNFFCVIQTENVHSFLIMWYWHKVIVKLLDLLTHLLVFSIVVKDKYISMFRSKWSIIWNILIVLIYDFLSFPQYNPLYSLVKIIYNTYNELLKW